MRLSSLGDSRSRFFRAFGLVAIEGDWRESVRFLLEDATVHQTSRIVIPSETSEALRLLERNAFDAMVVGRNYIGAGSPNFDWLAVTTASEQQLDALRQLGCIPEAFRSVHPILKDRQRNKPPN